MKINQHFGKYRGKVIENKDPLNLGRIQAVVPAVSENALNWALPSVPYAGPKVGLFTIPPLGANVWIEFEAGDPNYPIWSGCFWGSQEKEAPPPDATAPEIKVFQTEKMVLILDDREVRLTAKVVTDNDPMTLVMDTKGIVLTAAKTTITITPDKIEMKKDPAAIEVAEAISLKKTTASIQVSDSISVKNAAASLEISNSAINLKNGAASVALSPASVNINNGALEVI